MAYRLVLMVPNQYNKILFHLCNLYSFSGSSEIPAAPWEEDVGPAGGWATGMWQGPGTLGTACSTTDQQLPSSLSMGKCIFNQVFEEIKSWKKQSTYSLDSIWKTLDS